MFGKKPQNRRSIDEATEFATIIGEGTVFEGMLRGQDNQLISGKIIGECDLDGLLYLAASGQWQGNIKADIVIIAGTVEGNVFAKNKLELAESGRVSGNLEAPRIAIAEGAVYDGKIKMGKSTEVTRFKERRGTESPETE
ncbi:MAG: polymer-forming cytoskeletal protein [Gammaproteobacteria bacterium]|nr:polymer-forming cytoskeletal protein [Gammaproteobacteria bacterium]